VYRGSAYSPRAAPDSPVLRCGSRPRRAWTPPARRGIASGIVNAGGSFGQFVLCRSRRESPRSPAGRSRSRAWRRSSCSRCRRRGSCAAARRTRGGQCQRGLRAGARRDDARGDPRALRTPGYLLLAAGFFVCGFHVAFIATTCRASSPRAATAAVGAVGARDRRLFNIVGSFAIGWAVGRWRMKSLLSLIYAARGRRRPLRSCSRPRPRRCVLVFAAFIGLTYLSTVPPTAGLVAKFFGTAHMATLFGFVMPVASDRRILGGLARRQGVRMDRQLQLDVVRRHRARARSAR
jgi:hypothetical protein